MREMIRGCRKRYREADYSDKMMLVSTGSFFVNAVIGAGKLVLGIALFSPWFMATAVYYLLLCGARGQLLWRLKRRASEQGACFERQAVVFRRSGIFVCLMGVSYFFVCLRMYFWGEGNVYPFYIVYGVAAVAFYKVGMSVYGLRVCRKMKNPLLAAMKIIGLMDACVSIVAVQCALISMESSAASATQSSALLGMAFSVGFVCMGIYMLARKKACPPDPAEKAAAGNIEPR